MKTEWFQSFYGWSSVNIWKISVFPKFTDKKIWQYFAMRSMEKSWRSLGQVWKIDDFNDILLWLLNAVYFGSPIDKWRQKRGFGHRGSILTSVAAKIYKSMLNNRLRHHIDPILRRNQTDSTKIDPRLDKFSASDI